MKGRFLLQIDDWVEIHELPGSWPNESLREVLRLADFDDEVSDAELRDMAVLALQDLDEQAAGELVLQVVFGDKLSSGVRQNLVDDLEDDRPWEQFASIDKQAGIFETMVLLQQVFPLRFGIPDAIRLRLVVQATDVETTTRLRSGPSAPFILRLLASGMPDDAVLNRLYSSELQADAFADAGAILWMIDHVNSSDVAEPASFTCDIYASWQWLEPLEDITAWEGSGWPDGRLKSSPAR